MPSLPRSERHSLLIFGRMDSASLNACLILNVQKTFCECRLLDKN